MNRCKSCDHPIVWARTEPREATARKPAKEARGIPLNADETGAPITYEDGNIVVTGQMVPGSRGGAAVMEVRYTAPGRGAFKTHFSDCPNADQHRRSR